MKSKNQHRRLKKKQDKQLKLKCDTDVKNEPQLTPPHIQTSDLAERFSELEKKPELQEMIQDVSRRFKRPQSVQEQANGDTETEQDVKYIKPQENPTPSRKQQRLQQKPLLGDLKKQTIRPELVEWFDADAPHPEFLITLKTLPSSVQVPSNWRMRSEIPQFNGKPKYELPANIQETGISEQRAVSTESRRLDVDYEKLHDAFFTTRGRKLAEPVSLLTLGQVADLHYKTRPRVQSNSIGSSARPEKPSPQLLKALGLKPGEPLPWETLLEEMGLAPGYTQVKPVKLWGAL